MLNGAFARTHSLLFVLVAFPMLNVASAQDTLPSLDSDLQVAFSGIVFDRATNTFDTTATITNTSNQTLSGPFSFVLSTITPTSVTLENATCHTPDDKPVLVGTFPGTGLAPAGSLSNFVLKFSNPLRLAFIYTHTILAGNVCTSDQVLVLHAFSDSRRLPDEATILQALRPLTPLYCQAILPVSPLTLDQAMASMMQKLDQLAGPGAVESVLNAAAQTNEELLTATAAAAMADKKGPGALVALLAAHQNDPQNPAHLVNAAGAAAQLSLPNEALALLDAADAMGGDFGSPMGIDGHALALNNRGFALLQLGQWAQAQTALNAAIALEPLLSEARGNLAVPSLCQGDAPAAAHLFRAALTRPPVQPNLDQAFDLSQGVPPDLAPLPYPAVANQLHAYREFYAQFNPATHGKAIDLFNQGSQALDQFTQQLVTSPLPVLTELRFTDIVNDAVTVLGQEQFNSQSPEGLSDLWAVEQTNQQAAITLANDLGTELLAFQTNLPPCCSAAFQAATARGRSRVKQALTQFLYTQGRFEQSVRAFADPWYRDMTGLAANLSDPLLHQYVSLESKALLTNVYGDLTQSAFITLNVLDPYWQLSQGLEESASPQSAGPTPGSSFACPDALNVAKVSLDFFGIMNVSFNCEKVEATVSEPGIGLFAQLAVPRRGDWTVFAGAKGSLPGTTLGAKTGFYISGNDNSFTDAGIKFSQSGSIGPLKFESPFGFKAGIADVVACPLGNC